MTGDVVIFLLYDNALQLVPVGAVVLLIPEGILVFVISKPSFLLIRDEDGRTKIEVIIKLGEEVACHTSQPGWFLEVGPEVPGGEEENLVLLLIEEMVMVKALEKGKATNTPCQDEDIWVI